jgi:hypothetical protein
LTPWTADLLGGNGEAFLGLPDDVPELAHLGDRRAPSVVRYWKNSLARDPPALTVLGMISTVQAAFMGKPVVYFSPPDDFDTHLVESGGARLADETSLSGILAELLREPVNEGALRAALVGSGYVVDADVVMAEMIMEALGRGG